MLHGAITSSAPPRIRTPTSSPRRKRCCARQIHSTTSAASTNGTGSRSARVSTAAPNASPPTPKIHVRPSRAATASSANAVVSQNAPNGSVSCSPVARISGG